MASEIAELEQLVTPIDKLVVQYLQENKSGATLTKIVHRVKCEAGDCGDVRRSVAGVLAKGTELGFIEKHSPKRSMKTTAPCRCVRRRVRRAPRRTGCAVA